MSQSLLPETFEQVRSVLRVSQDFFHFLVKKCPPLKV